MVHFVGAGPGDPDLITVKGKRLLEHAQTVIYAGSLVNPALLSFCPEGCRIYDSARMTLEEVIRVMEACHEAGQDVVRLHTGDPSLYGAIKEQMDRLDELSIPYQVCPGVSAFSGAAAALGLEYTLPGISQSVVITRMEGRTPVPEKEKIQSFAAHQSTMVLFLSTGLLGKLSQALVEGGYPPDTPAAIVYKATWPDERVIRCTVGTLAQRGVQEGIRKTALLLIGEFLDPSYQRSRLYDPTFTTEFRQASSPGPQSPQAT